MVEELAKRMADAVLGSAEPGGGVDVGIAIAGGGLGGLALAVGLRERGYDAHVFEAAPELRTDSATIISIGANGNCALDGLKAGLADAILARGIRAETMKYVTVKAGGGAPVVRHPPVRITVVRWAAVQETLASLLPPEAVHCSHKVESYSALEGGVEASFSLPAAAAEKHYYVSADVSNEGSLRKKVRARLLVGADGIRSAVRKGMCPGDEPQYVCALNWNAVIEDNGDSAAFGHGKGELVKLVTEDLAIQGFTSDTGEGYTFWQLRQLDPTRELSKALGDDWGGLGAPGVKERTLAVLEGLGAEWDCFRNVIQATDEGAIFERRIMDRKPLDSWSDCNGHVVLLGDAAHAFYPGPGEGARQAFEDAHQLTLALEEKAGTSLEPAKVEQAVNRYEDLRIKRCRALHHYARGSSGLPDDERLLPEVRALSKEEIAERNAEFVRWMESYPDNPNGLEGSKYFPPES